MPAIEPRVTSDPLEAFVAGAYVTDSNRPVPLVSTKFDITIEAGLAVVETQRRFRNFEQESIEATITFPVPIHSTLFSLEARIDGRLLKARAQRRAQAREIYEDAMERGQAAVLHEEVLRGVHMLSVGQVGPSGEIEITTKWAATLSIVDRQGRLRVPLTVGDIYGRPPLIDSDTLVHGGPCQSAELVVSSRDGLVELQGGRLEEGRARVPLSRPIDLVVVGWTPRELHGCSADGRKVILQIEPREAREEALDVAILVDRSGSMADICSTQRSRQTKHAAVIESLGAAVERFRGGDALDLWEFNNAVRHVGSETRDRIVDHSTQEVALRTYAGLLDRLSEPSGGTEIGAALAQVVKRSAASDILLVTDGKSYALDVQALARSGRRISVILVGEDSLEANVGHLAALTGGDIFVASGSDIPKIVDAALGALRGPREKPVLITGKRWKVNVVRGNAVVSVQWRSSAVPVANSALGRAVAAVGASVALPSLSAKAATTLAEDEGLVTYLTSLILVDEAGAAQEGISAVRKISLPTPDVGEHFSGRGSPIEGHFSMSRSVVRPLIANPTTPSREAILLSFLGSKEIDRTGVVASINWDLAPAKLIAGDLSMLEPEAEAWIWDTAETPKVIALANELGLSPIMLVIAALAQSNAAKNRSAARIASTVLGVRTLHEIERIRVTIEP